MKNTLLDCAVIMEPFARQELAEAGNRGQTLLLSLDQTELGNRMALLMLSLRIGNRGLPLLWIAEAGAANIGYEKQKQLLEHVLCWLPANAQVMLLADRFYPSRELFEWLQLRRQIIYAARKKTREQTDPEHWRFKKLYRSGVSLFKRGLRRLMRCLQNDLPLPVFCEVMRN